MCCESGAFACIKEGIESLIHKSTISNIEKTQITTYFIKGQKVKVKIIQIDEMNRRIGLALINPQKDGK